MRHPSRGSPAAGGLALTAKAPATAEGHDGRPPGEHGLRRSNPQPPSWAMVGRCGRNSAEANPEPRDRDDVNEPVEETEVIAVACVERHPVSDRRRDDEQIEPRGAPRLAAGRNHRGVHEAIPRSCLGVERHGVEHDLGTLQAILSASSLESRPGWQYADRR